MISYSEVSRMAKQAARNSQKAHQVPAIWHGTKVGFYMPFLGDRTPRGWKRTERIPMFVDSSGYGSYNETALTQDEFFDDILVGFGYATIEQGQFQCYVAEYQKT